VQQTHDWEHLEHLVCEARRLPPILASKGDLGDLLPRAEAVVGGTPGEPALPEAVVNSAAEVRL
jgi:hypothetical protein